MCVTKSLFLFSVQEIRAPSTAAAEEHKKKWRCSRDVCVRRQVRDEHFKWRFLSWRQRSLRNWSDVTVAMDWVNAVATTLKPQQQQHQRVACQSSLSSTLSLSQPICNQCSSNTATNSKGFIFSCKLNFLDVQLCYCCFEFVWFWIFYHFTRLLELGI